jgi:uncharacterized protein DUF5680
MDTAELSRFLRNANLQGYAAGRAARQRREADQSTTIEYRAGEWTFNDNFFGGEPYGGRSIVSRGDAPIWMAVYYGWVEAPPSQVQPIYAFLQRSLLLAPEDFPVRGPAEFSADSFAYRNMHHGGLERFSGEETIHDGGKRVYTAWFCGGVVDRRPGD